MHGNEQHKVCHVSLKSYFEYVNNFVRLLKKDYSYLKINKYFKIIFLSEASKIFACSERNRPDQ